MAEAGLEWFSQPIISELVNKSISYLGSDIANIAEALQHLETILPKLQLGFQEPQHRRYKPEFVSWLARLKDAYFDAEAVLHDLESKRLKSKAKGENKKLLVRLSSKPIIKPLVNFLKRDSPLLSPEKRKLLHRLKQLKEVAAETNTFCELLGISDTESTDGIIADNRSFITCSLLPHKVFGLEGERDDIIEFLLDEQRVSSSRNSYSVVAVTGMGGAGKTTLAQYVYNDPKVEKHFGVRMWLHLFENLDIIERTKEMIERASGKTCPDLGNLDFLQNMLRETLCESDNIMVVLDDVWYDPEVVENDYWDILLKPFSRREGTCKIVVTSRSTLFPLILEPNKFIPLSDMPLDDFTSLLRYRAIDGLQFNNSQLKDDLSDILDQIAKKLSKLPLVANVVGNQLREQPDITYWQATLKNPNLSGMMEILWSIQRLDVQFQRCFSFCSIFPKGTRYNLDSLIPYWVALDFIRPSDNNRNIEDIGLECFEKMVANSIFHPVDKTSKWYIMHDLFYDLAKNLSAKDCCRITNDEREIPSTVQHVYLQCNNENLQKNLSSICNLKYLRTLILENPNIDAIFFLKFSRNLRNLRVLELQSWGYKILPTVVGDFRNLRFLSFWKGSIEELPDSLLQLNRLQFLELPSSVKTLPTNFSNLDELRYIKMYNRYGHQVFTLPPVPYIGNLTSLQVLQEFHVRKEKGYELHQLGPLNEIGGSLRIVNLENVSDKNEADEARLINKRKLKKLELVWAQSTEINGLETEVIEALQPPPNLELLKIDGFGGSTYPTWMHKYSFIKYIKDDRFYNCKALTNLPPSFDQCSNCSELILQNLGALRELPTFPEKLARLSIIKCPCLIFVCENELQVNEKQSIMESQFLRHGVEGCKDILDHELNSFKQIGLAESCTEQLKILETSELGDDPKQWVNVNGAWWHCHQQRMNFIFTQANKNELKLPSTLRVVHLGYCCVSDGALSGCLRGMSTLEELHLEGIMTITTLPPAEVLMSLNNLRVLEIRHCWYLGSLGDFHALPHLKRCLILGYTPMVPTLQFKCCPPLPPTLQSFVVNNCCIWYKQ